jgi:hypothetical protein
MRCNPQSYQFRFPSLKRRKRSEHNTIDWRKQNNIPDSDEINIELGQTRKT